MVYGQNSGIYESYLILDTGSGNTFYDLQATTGNPDFIGADLGTYQSGDVFFLRGAQIKTYKCVLDNILNGQIFYRIHNQSDPAPAFINLSYLNHQADLGAGPECGGSSFRQRWGYAGFNIPVLQTLSSGDYFLEVYLVAEYNLGTPPNALRYDSNNSVNYRASFRIDNPPTALCQDITINLDSVGNASITPSDIDNGSYDDLDANVTLVSVTP
ncbi:MAG: hypothetical protein KJN82_06740, partial [Bacteroidia bacterium]|nr:hypothetical protein [Bacteroidia bacterium]